MRTDLRIQIVAVGVGGFPPMPTLSAGRRTADEARFVARVDATLEVAQDAEVDHQWQRYLIQSNQISEDERGVCWPTARCMPENSLRSKAKEPNRRLDAKSHCPMTHRGVDGSSEHAARASGQGARAAAPGGVRRRVRLRGHLTRGHAEGFEAGRRPRLAAADEDEVAAREGGEDGPPELRGEVLGQLREREAAQHALRLRHVGLLAGGRSVSEKWGALENA